MTKDLTRGPITKTMLLFAVPMILGNLLQQLYNVADTLIVGQFLGPDALAAVGSSYTLMTFLTSILLGLCMGSGAVFSIRCGEKNQNGLKVSIVHSFVMIAVLSVILNGLVFIFIDPILHFLKVPGSIYEMMRSYLWIIFYGITATFFYNFFASLLRAVGNSVTPLLFLGVWRRRSHAGNPAAGQQRVQLLRGHADRPHQLDDLQVLRLGFLRLQFPQPVLVFRQLFAGLCDLPVNPVDFVRCHL